MSSEEKKESQNSEEQSQEEVVFEEEVTESGQIKKLREKLKSCEKERKEYLDGWQRAKADLVNKKKGFEEKKKEIRSRANENLIQDIIPVLDSFQMAFGDTQQWKKVDKEWRSGIENIHTQLIGILKQYGVSVLQPAEGEAFDPEKHEATDIVSVQDQETDDTIHSVQKFGYTLHEKVIRPAHVVVSRVNEENA